MTPHLVITTMNKEDGRVLPIVLLAIHCLAAQSHTSRGHHDSKKQPDPTPSLCATICLARHEQILVKERVRRSG